MMTKQPRFSVFPPITLNPRSTFTRLACDVSALSLTCDECLPGSLSAHKAILSRSRLVMNILPALNQLRQGKNTEKAGPACRGNWWRMRYRMRHLIERLQEIYCYRMRHLIKRLQEIYYTTEWDILYQKIARNILYHRMRHLIKRLHEIYHYWMRHLITKDGKMRFFPTWCFWWKNFDIIEDLKKSFKGMKILSETFQFLCISANSLIALLLPAGHLAEFERDMHIQQSHLLALSL